MLNYQRRWGRRVPDRKKEPHFYILNQYPLEFAVLHLHVALSVGGDLATSDVWIVMVRMFGSDN